MTIYEQLKSDHRNVIALLDELIAAEKDTPKRREMLVAKIGEELIPHARAEEAVLYNSMRDLDVAGGVVGHSYQEHLEAEAVFRSLQVTDAVNVNWVGGAKKLKAALEHHIAEEEGKVFPAAQQLFTNPEAEAMAEVFNRMKPAIRKQSFVGQSADMVVNMMPGRLRDSFAKFTNLPIAS